jgi:hypothetical protein
MRLPVAVAALAGSIVLIAAGCSGGDDEADPGAAETAVSGGQALGPVPKGLAGWPADADELCVAVIVRFHSAQRPGDATRAYELLHQAARLGAVDLELLESLRPPPAARQGRDVLLAALNVQLIALQELAEATADGNEARARIALDRAADARVRARPFARELGLDGCARAAVR